MSKIVFLFCEDDCHMGILANITSGLASEYDIRTVKTGGVRGQNAFVEGFLNRGGASTSSRSIVFRDRDFDFPIPDKPELRVEEKENKSICTLYRVTAENYLLSPELFKAYFQHLGKATQIDFADIFETSARQIATYSAARHTLAFFRDNFSFRTSWTPQSGKLPTSLDREFCLKNAWSLVDEKQGKLCPINQTEFQEKYASFFSKFDDNFFRSQQYFIWFNGKDLETSINQNLPKGSSISMEAYYRFALRQFDFRHFPDLVQFHNFLTTL